MQVNNKQQELLQLLPGFNCGACGYSDCGQFASALAKNNASTDKCTVLQQERFKTNKAALQKLNSTTHLKTQKPELIGLIDGVKADFLLHPLKYEPSCRETLVCFAGKSLKKGMIIRYRPLGCPITHFAEIIETENGLYDVWVVGPGKLLGRKEEVTDVGICMILSFQGIIEGAAPKIGQTVRFLPSYCMMGKVHSGVIVQLKDNSVRIDCIDLKTWQHTNNK